ncbi:hypothetical protein [Paenibacillus sp. UMB4589-SE434]|uniref:hypothetical protein n=1 Tax=Paenibacillus sp. UMB4589-SE434 TaxID=3046314 RepID=UPI00255147F3|nr:hypothetical protein [Paenibacillus sp. UMB4589-SE434]MDK8181208.1 hypothetical protein [Paenibacillus sp. UMB4589-SE434]
MGQQAFVQVQSEYRWYDMSPAGIIKHAVHQIQAAPSFIEWETQREVREASMLPLAEELHMLLLTVNGVYYVRRNAKRGQEVRIDFHADTFAPYLFIHNETMYFGYVVYNQGSASFMLRSYRKGVWRDQRYTFPCEVIGGDGVLFRQAVYTIGRGQQLHGLFHLYQPSTETDVLIGMQMNLCDQQTDWQALFEARAQHELGTLAIHSDAAGYTHAAWSIRHQHALHYYYKNMSIIGGTPSVYIGYDGELPRPCFIHAQDALLLAYVNAAGRIVYAVTTDKGKQWSSYREVVYGSPAAIQFVQTTCTTGEYVFPYEAIGISAPYFRPLSWQDVIHPFFTLKGKLPPEQLLNGIIQEMEHISNYVIQQTTTLQAEISRLYVQKEQAAWTLKKLEEQLFHLDETEMELNQQLHRHHWPVPMEPISNRHIR